MLSSCTNSRREYLKELHNKNLLNMLTINTRYVSNVSIGFQVRPVTPHVRYKPYKHPKREERHRTRSENNDNDSTSLVKAVLEERIHQSIDDLNQLKKAKSLESIVCESKKNVDLKNVPIANCPELEVVSNCIQNLKVAEWWSTDMIVLYTECMWPKWL